MLPGHIDIPAAWFGEDLVSKPNIWHYTLQDAEIDELITAANKFCASGEELGKITPKNFVLGIFSFKLFELQKENKELKKKMWWKKPKMQLLVAFLVLAVLGAIIAIIVVMTDDKKKD